jgi:hypothetical protein
MGSILFDFLTESVLFDLGQLKDRYLGLPDSELIEILQRYRAFCLSHREELVAEAVDTKSGFHVFPGTHSVHPNLLRQSALYVERYVLSDPLFLLTDQEKPYGRAMRSYLGHDDPHRLDRMRIAEAVTQLKNLTPMIAADYVKFLPVSYLFESPKDLPIYYSKTRFSDVLPADLLSLFHQHKRVHALRRDKTGWIEDRSAHVSRGIAIEFGDDYSAGMMYQLFEQEIESFDEAARTYTGRISLPESPPAQAYYDSWVEQSVNRTAINFYDRLCTELMLSVQLGASYLCFSEFRNELLAKFFPVRVGTAEHSANVILQLSLPFLDEIDTEALMKVRCDDGEAFQVFRHELERQFWDLRMEEDPNKLRIKAEKVMHELGSIQHEQLTLKLKQLCRGSLASAVILSATLGGTFMASGHYLPALIGAAAAGYKLKSDYDAALRQNPSFFLWKARRSSYGKYL